VEHFTTFGTGYDESEKGDGKGWIHSATERYIASMSTVMVEGHAFITGLSANKTFL
jgi:hypothetical protein